MGILDDILAGIEEPDDTKKKQQDPAGPNTDPKEPGTAESAGTPWYSTSSGTHTRSRTRPKRNALGCIALQGGVIIG